MRLVKYVALLAALVLAVAACGDDAADDGAGLDDPGDVSAPGDDAAGAGADLGDDVAAVVGGHEITTADIQEQVESFAGSPQLAEVLEGPEGEEMLGLLTAEVIQTAIFNHLAVGAAEELDAPVTDEDLDQARAELEEETGGPENLAAALEQQGMTDDQLRTQLRALAALRNIEGALGEENGVDEAEAEVLAQQYLTERVQSTEVVVNDDFGTWDAETGQVVPPGGLPQQPQQPVPAPQ